MSYLPHVVVLAERASHARGSEEFRGTNGIRAGCSARVAGHLALNVLGDVQRS